MFIAASFRIVKKWKPPKYPSIDDWINKMWFTRTMDIIPSMKMNKHKKVQTCYSMDEP